MTTRRNSSKSDSMSPMNLEAEQGILGAIILDNQCYFEAAMVLRNDDFFGDSNRRIYAAIQELDANGRPFDFLTVSQILIEHNELEACGGVSYLTSLTDGLPRSKNILHLVNIVADYARRRRIINAANVTLQRAIDLTEPTDEILSSAQNQFLAISASSQRVKAEKVEEFIGEMFQKLREQAHQPRTTELLGLSFGFNELDIETSGAMPGETVVVAGYSGHGKSLLAAQMIWANVIKGVNTLVFTQEMTKQQYLRRMIPAATRGFIPGYQLRDLRGMSPEDMFLLDEAEKKLEKLPLWTVDASSVDVSELRAVSRLMIRQNKIQLIVADFIQLFTARGTNSDPERLSLISGCLREVAKDEKVVTVQVSQLTPAERGKILLPNIYMLRQSGDIAQNAHIALFIYRPQNTKGYLNGKDQIRIGKMRDGSARPPFPVELDRNTLQWVKRADTDTQQDEEEAPFLGKKATTK